MATELFEKAENAIFFGDCYHSAIEALDALVDEIDDDAMWETGRCVSYVDILTGAYWFCFDHYGGQCSVLYSILSRIPYTPSASATGPDEYSAESDVYQALRELFLK